MRTRARTIDLGVTPDAGHGYGTALIGVPERRTVLFTYREPPAAMRLAKLELDAGRTTVLKGLKGELIDGVVDAKHGVVHALTSHGLLRVGLEPFAALGTTETKLPTYPNGLVESKELGALFVRWNPKATAARVDVAGYDVTSRVAMPDLQLSFAFRGKPTLFSFEAGKARAIDAKGKLGKPFAITRLQAPILTKRAVIGFDGDTVVTLDRETLEPVGRKTVRGARALLGLDAKERLVVAMTKGVALVDLESMTIVARIASKKELFVPVLAGPSTVVAFTKARFSHDVSVLEWDDDATIRPKAPDVVARKATPLPERAGTGRLVFTKRVFKSEIAVAKRTYAHERVVDPELAGIELERCTIEHCLLGSAAARLRARDVHARRLLLRWSGARNVVFEECSFDIARAAHGQTYVGCAFRHVTLRGDLGLARVESWEENGDRNVPAKRASALDAEVRSFYDDVDWALDLREADASSFRIRNVPLALVRRDPERQLLVWAEHAAHAVWRSRALARSIWRDDVAAIGRKGREGVLLHVIDDDDRRARDALRKAGVLDDRTGVVT